MRLFFIGLFAVLFLTSSARAEELKLPEKFLGSWESATGKDLHQKFIGGEIQEFSSFGHPTLDSTSQYKIVTIDKQQNKLILFLEHHDDPKIATKSVWYELRQYTYISDSFPTQPMISFYGYDCDAANDLNWKNWQSGDGKIKDEIAMKLLACVVEKNRYGPSHYKRLYTKPSFGTNKASE